MKNNRYEKVTCPYCSLTGSGPNMKRYHFDNCKLINSDMFRYKPSEETKKKISESQKGKKRKPHTEETKKKMSNSHKGKSYKIVTCPHCGKTGGSGGMKTWHFDNCQTKGKLNDN